jgi:hypothetical protein
MSNTGYSGQDTRTREELLNIVEQVEDVLIVNWIPVKNNDYKQALADLCHGAIVEARYFDDQKDVANDL